MIKKVLLAIFILTSTCLAVESVDVESLGIQHRTTIVWVNQTATPLPSTPLPGRKVISVQNLESSIIVYLGNSNVTASEAPTGGYQLMNKGDRWIGDFTDENIVYGIASEPACVLVWEAR